MPKRDFIGSVAEKGIIYGITNQRTLIVTSGQFSDDKHIVIPEKVAGMLVVGIAEEAFQNSEKIHSIHLPPTLTEVENYAFNRCVNLKNVKMHASTVYLGSSAFAHCQNLMRVEGNDIMTLSDRAFWKCPKLEKIYANFRGDVFTQTFGGCWALKDITFSNVSLHRLVFWGCKSLKTLYFNGTVSAPDDVMQEIAKRTVVCNADSPLVELGYNGTSIIVKD